jgi:UDP-N-acetylglucosamine 4,6-dehydratase
MSLDDKTILITGGTGSFGRAFLKRVLSAYEPRAVRVLSRDELKQWELQQEFGDDERLRFLIGDIRDLERLRIAFRGVDIVVHAAALKQVPVCEYNPFEAVQTNVLGSENVIRAALDCEVERVVAISSDKAVSPANLYGATKLCAEKLFVRANAYVGDRPTRFACARYGNVAGSRGSVIPLFVKQASTGQVTITDERMTRFLITLESAVDFVISCVSEMRGGEVCIPKTPSVRIVDVAEAVAPGAERVSIGLRPGEKLHEVLLASDEARHAIELPDRYVILPDQPSWSTLAPWPDGEPVAEGFEYRSDTNRWWLTVEEIARIAKTL